MKVAFQISLALCSLVLAPSLIAENVQDSQNIVCATGTALLCVENGDCFRVVPDEIDLPRFILIDTKKRTLSTTKLSNRPRNTQIERLIQARATVLVEHVLAGDAENGRPVLHVGRNVGRADQHQLDAVEIGREYQPPAAGKIVRRFDTGALQQRQGFLENPALGQGNGYFVRHG